MQLTENMKHFMVHQGLSPRQMQFLISARRDGAKCSEIAQFLNCSTATISKAFRDVDRVPLAERRQEFDALRLY